jgi:spoIIIJ-associated protein
VSQADATETTEANEAAEAGEANEVSETAGAGESADPAEPDKTDEPAEAEPGASAETAETAEQADGADGAEDGQAAEAGEAPEIDVKALEEESEIAADYIEGLLDVADFDGDIDMDVEGERAIVSVVGATLDELVGKKGEVLEALQELTRLAVHRRTGNRSRLMLDIGGYRRRRRAELTELGRKAAEEVKASGQAKPLAVMTPFERKVVHDAVAEAGLRSESEGEEPARHVVVLPV